MTKFGANQVLKIIAEGGGCILDTEDFSNEQLIEIAEAALQHEVTVIFRNAKILSVDQLRRVAKYGRGRVIFDL